MSIHEALQETLGKLEEVMEGKIKDDRWFEATREFTRQLEALGMMVEVLGLEVDLHGYPRL